jgi:hypothetical protein
VHATKPSFLNFKVDHMTLLLQPEMYAVSYALFRIVFGAGARDILYNKTKEWAPGEGERSMTFATMIGNAPEESREVDKTIIAVVQPTEPAKQPSHVRRMLGDHAAAAHWQHIALRTPDLMAFHQYALERGINFITPILKDADEDLIQVFSGEWFYPGIGPSGMFFEFVQRNPSVAALKRLEDRNRESWFQDKTFLGLYGEKEREYQSGKVTPFIDFELFEQLRAEIKGREVFQITEADLQKMEDLMIKYAAKRANR